MQVLAGIVFPSNKDEAVSWMKQRHPSKRPSPIYAARQLGEYMGHMLALDESYAGGYSGISNPFPKNTHAASHEKFKETFIAHYRKFY